MTAYQEIIKIIPQFPFEVLKDIERRTGDWMWSGGNEDDPYIHQHGMRDILLGGKRVKYDKQKCPKCGRSCKT